MPRAFTQQEKDVIGSRLLHQGQKMFSAHGLAKTNVEELARAAGISKGAFYGFYESKEALFMHIIEQAEVRLRREVMAVIDLPGPSPRARLYAVLKKAFGVFERMPILQVLSGSEYELLFRGVSAEQLHEHLLADRLFLDELIARCRAAGIPIQAQSQELANMLYPLVLAVLHKEDLGLQTFGGNVDLLLELIAAYCVGELQPDRTGRTRRPRKEPAA